MAALGRFTRAREVFCLHHLQLFRLGRSVLCLSLGCTSLRNPPQQRSPTRRLETPALPRFTGRTLGNVLISAQERVKLAAALGWCLTVPGAEASRACSFSGGRTRPAGLCVPQSASSQEAGSCCITRVGRASWAGPGGLVRSRRGLLSRHSLSPSPGAAEGSGGTVAVFRSPGRVSCKPRVQPSGPPAVTSHQLLLDDMTFASPLGK